MDKSLLNINECELRRELQESVGELFGNTPLERRNMNFEANSEGINSIRKVFKEEFPSYGDFKPTKAFLAGIGNVEIKKNNSLQGILITIKEERIVLRATTEFKEILDELAKELGLSNSAYIRMLVNKEALKRKDG